MLAKVGDWIILAANRTGGAVRDGEVVEVRDPQGHPPYRVRWRDGRSALVFPGADAVVHPSRPDEPSPAAAAAAAEAARVAKTWHVVISVHEAGDDTSATAVLTEHGQQHVAAEGAAHRSAADQPAPAIGDEVAVARALRRLADDLLEHATKTIGASTGDDVFIRPR